MIRNAVLHLVGEQPLFADLETFPSPTDAGVVCTNVRYMNGKAPLFIDHKDSWFLFPMGQIRFLEMPASTRANEGVDAEDVPPDEEALESPIELELDEDFLRRIREA